MASSLQRIVTPVLDREPGLDPGTGPLLTTRRPAERGAGKAADDEPSPAGAGNEGLEGTPLAVSVRGLTRAFASNTVIDGLDLDIPAGQFVVLLGASGCGKSTLLRILADLDTEISGEVRVPARRAVAFQSPRLLPWKRVWRNVVLGLPGRPDRARAAAALAEVGLGSRADAWPRTLSGGEAQRTSLARALVREPELLLLDEPFGALDALTRLKAQDLVWRLWHRHQPAVLLVTHDVEEALLLADRVLVMKDGVIDHSVDVDLPRPRDVGDPTFISLRADLLGWLGVDAYGPSA
ncbi:MAG: ABC transporter ATP-binding protein [Frankia sp.]